MTNEEHDNAAALRGWALPARTSFANGCQSALIHDSQRSCQRAADSVYSMQEGRPCGYVDVRLGVAGEGQQQADVTLLEPAGARWSRANLNSAGIAVAVQRARGLPPARTVSLMCAAFIDVGAGLPVCNKCSAGMQAVLLWPWSREMRKLRSVPSEKPSAACTGLHLLASPCHERRSHWLSNAVQDGIRTRTRTEHLGVHARRHPRFPQQSTGGALLLVRIEHAGKYRDGSGHHICT